MNFRSTLRFTRAFFNEAVIGVMPSGKTVCDIQTLTIWCAHVDVIFAQIVVNQNEVFVSCGKGLFTSMGLVIIILMQIIFFIRKARSQTTAYCG